jgi:hypothetical protein
MTWITGQLRVVVMSMAIVGSAVAGGATGASAASPRRQLAPEDCPTILASAQVTKGMEGTGWTVVTGDEPQPFKVEVLGTVPDGIAPGRDLVVIEVSDLPGSTFIEDAGGIWAGMSGSPVYDNASGMLIGAVAYGFTAAPSPIGGMTPASQMRQILDISSRSGISGKPATHSRVLLSRALRNEIVRRTGNRAAADAGLARLPIPLMVSGLRARGRHRLERYLEQRGGDYLVVSGGRARRPADVPADRPVAGGNFTAVYSYGDVTAGAVGTTTYVCGNEALAFGHPAQFIGRANYGANDGDALAIIKDTTFGSFKAATIGASFGTVDQDRLAGLRADLTETPSLIPVVVKVNALDLQRTRTGRSEVTSSDLVPGIAPDQLLADIDSTSDRVGQGTATIHFTVRGRRANGAAWVLQRADRIASGDVSLDADFALFDALSQIAGNQFEQVRFDSVNVTADVTEAFSALDIRDVRVSVNGGPFQQTDNLTLSAGDQLVVRVTLRQYRGGLEYVRVPLRVPSTASGSGVLDVAGGNDFAAPDCTVETTGCPQSFPGLLHQLKTAPRNDDIVTSLQLYQDEASTPTGPSVRTRKRSIVTGDRQIQVVVNP